MVLCWTSARAQSCKAEPRLSRRWSFQAPSGPLGVVQFAELKGRAQSLTELAPLVMSAETAGGSLGAKPREVRALAGLDGRPATASRQLGPERSKTGFTRQQYLTDPRKLIADFYQAPSCVDGGLLQELMFFWAVNRQKLMCRAEW